MFYRQRNEFRHKLLGRYTASKTFSPNLLEKRRMKSAVKVVSHTRLCTEADVILVLQSSKRNCSRQICLLAPPQSAFSHDGCCHIARTHLSLFENNCVQLVRYLSFPFETQQKCLCEKDRYSYSNEQEPSDLTLPFHWNL